MNLNRMRVFLQCSITIARTNYCELLVTNVGCFKNTKPTSTFVRIFSTISSSTKPGNSLEFESDCEFDTLPDEDPNYGSIDYETIAENDPEKIKKLKLFQLELRILAQDGQQVPKIMRPKHWQQLLFMESRFQRFRHYRFLWTKETKKENEQLQKREKFENYLFKKEIREIEDETGSSLQYGLAKNTLFYRIYPPQVHNMYNWKLLQASVFGRDLLVDCGYEEYMYSEEITLCARQILNMWSANRESFYPFNLIFCNYKRDGSLSERLLELIPSLYDDKFPFTYTEKHYLDLFPREKLVYLTPHCSEIMEKYEPDCVYIMGGVTEKYRSEHVSLAKAKKDGLRFAKFPLDRYLDWGFGVKTLTLKECVGIVTELKDGHDWNDAFKHIYRKRLVKQKSLPEKVESRGHKFRAKRPRKLDSQALLFELLKGT